MHEMTFKMPLKVACYSYITAWDHVVSGKASGSAGRAGGCVDEDTGVSNVKLHTVPFFSYCIHANEAASDETVLSASCGAVGFRSLSCGDPSFSRKSPTATQPLHSGSYLSKFSLNLAQARRLHCMMNWLRCLSWQSLTSTKAGQTPQSSWEERRWRGVPSSSFYRSNHGRLCQTGAVPDGKETNRYNPLHQGEQ